MIILNKENLTQAWECGRRWISYFISVRKISFFLAIWKWTFHSLNVFWKVKYNNNMEFIKTKNYRRKEMGIML